MWFVASWLRDAVRQGNQFNGVVGVYRAIWREAIREFHEDNHATLKGFLLQCFEQAAPKEYSLWIHNKTGDKYVLVDWVKNCTNDRDTERMVAYRKLENGVVQEQVYVRNLDEFRLKFTAIEWRKSCNLKGSV